MKKKLKKKEHGINLEDQNLPLVINKYKILSLLGGGAFGRVFLVQDIKTKEKYAMKTVSFTPEKPGVSKKQQKTIIQSAETEKQLLAKMDSENIVKIKGSFVIDRNPLKEIGSKRAAHLCILIEYIHGSDLNDLLTNAEKDKSIQIPLDCCIYWFLKLLETLKYIHSINIIHRDLKPDNILVEYGSYLEDFKKMKLKISDFGVGKELSEGKKASAISGQLFYTPPEVLKQEKGYDSRCDVWSLGIIFLQVYSLISIKTYQQAVSDIFKSIKSSPELNIKFCKRYGMKTMENVSLLPLLLFMHEHNLFYVIIERFVKDPGVSAVLNRMICPEEDRLKSNELLELKIVKTWRYILNLSNKIDKNDFDMLGIICFLGMKKYDQIIFTKCLDLLKENVSKNVEDFVRHNGIEVLFKKLENLRDLYKKKFLYDIILICLKILLHFHNKVGESENKKQLEENEEILQKIYRRLSVYLRKYNCVKALTQIVNTKYSIPLYVFSYLMSYNSQAVRFIFIELIQTFLLRINKNNKFVIMPLLKLLLKHVTKKELETALKLYKFSDAFFFSHLTTEYKSFISKDIIGKICTKFKKIVKYELSIQVKSDTNKTKDLEMHLFLLFCFLKDFETLENEKEKVNDFNLYYNQAPSLKCKIKFKNAGRSQKKKVLFSNTSKRIFTVKVNDEKELIELISSEPICDFYKCLELLIGDKAEKEEFAVGYYEIYIENGGWKDDITIGILTANIQITLNCASGKVERDNQFQVKVKPIRCETGNTVGIGITNKGSIFFTHNNTLITPYVPFITKYTNPYDIKKGMFAFIKINGNMGFKGLLNFGKREYCFKFNKTKDEPRKVSGKKVKKFDLEFISVNVLKKKDKKCAILSTLQQKFVNKNSLSDIIITNILKIVENSDKSDDKSKDQKIDNIMKNNDEKRLQDHYSEFEKREYKEVIRTFKQSGYIKELTKKHSNAKQDIFAKYKSLQQSQSDRNYGIGILEKEEIRKRFEKQIEKDKKKKGIFESTNEKGIEEDLFAAVSPELLNRFLPEEEEIENLKVDEISGTLKKKNNLRKFFKGERRERSDSLSEMLLSKKLTSLKQKQLGVKKKEGE